MTEGDPLIAEALRVYRRYAVEVVEALGLCPWAEHARKTGRARELVLLADRPNVGPVLQAISEHTARPELEILLVIFPRLLTDRRRFEHFVAEIREADAKRHALGEIPFAMAAFHPDATPDLHDSERLIPFLRRTPDPTIQLVRRSSLDRVRERSPEGTEFVELRFIDPLAFASTETRSLRERIADTNRATVVELGVERVEALLADIRRDRNESYAKLTRAAGCE
jgi:hypothetical protein